MSKLQEIEGRFDGENFRFGDCLVGKAYLLNESIDIALKVGHDDNAISIKGDADPDELQERQSYRFYGRFSEYRNKRTGKTEKQFHFSSFVPMVAHDREGVIAYLENAGKGLGVGYATAAKAWQRWGTDTIRTVRNDPAAMLKINPKLDEEKLAELSRRLESQRATEDATIELTNLLNGRKLPKTTARKAIREWGNRAAEVIRRDPYRLMKFKGIGWKTADNLWLEFGLKKDRLRRQAMCAWFAVSDDSEGHTWIPAAKVAKFVRESIGSTARPVRAIELATRLGRIAPNHYGALSLRRTTEAGGPLTDSKVGTYPWLAEAKNAQAEERLAKAIAGACDEAKPRPITVYGLVESEEVHYLDHARCQRCGRQLTAPQVHIVDGQPYGPTCIDYLGKPSQVMQLDEWLQLNPKVFKTIQEAPKGRIELPQFSLWPDPANIVGISEHQREKLCQALVSRIAILGGGPGTGKTHTLAQLIKAILAGGRVGIEDIAVGAPTGKAAVRITEALTLAGLRGIKARTWHSLLGVGEDEESGASGFAHNAGNPWDFRIIFGDEESMKDLVLMQAVFAARPRSCHILLVGDIHQLPPVGNGAPLRDMIASGVAGYGELQKIERNSGGIVEACAAIRAGKPWEVGGNLKLMDSGTPEQQLQLILNELDSITFTTGIDPVWQCQVVVAVNAKSKVSRKYVNQVLQQKLNSNPVVSGSLFRMDDKVVCLENGDYTAILADSEARAESSQEGQVRVANGEVGRVVDIEPKSYVIELKTPDRTIRVPRGKSEAAESKEGEEEQEISASGCKWDLAYALSCHKSQGSEWPYVFVALDDSYGARRVCSREWLYTAISRAKEKCHLVGRKSTADSMCGRVALGKRKTFLRELIQLENCSREFDVFA